MHAGLSKEQHWNTFTKSLPLSPPPIRCVKVYHSSKQPAKSIVTMYLDFVFWKLDSISGFFRLHHFLLHQQRRKYKSLAHSTSYYIGGYITFRYVFLGVGNSQEKVLVPEAGNQCILYGISGNNNGRFSWYSDVTLTPPSNRGR